MECLVCQANLSPPDDEGWRTCPRGHGSFLYDQTRTSYLRDSPLPDDRELARELAAELEEDGARMRDFQAAERSTGFRDRSHGG